MIQVYTDNIKIFFEFKNMEYRFNVKKVCKQVRDQRKMKANKRLKYYLTLKPA